MGVTFAAPARRLGRSGAVNEHIPAGLTKINPEAMCKCYVLRATSTGRYCTASY